MKPTTKKILLFLTVTVIALSGLYAYHSYQERLRIERERYEEAMRVLGETLEANRTAAMKADEEYIAYQSAQYGQENDPAFREDTVGTTDKKADMIGDSVMLGAAQLLKQTFPNAYVDAAVNRAYYPLLNIVSERANKGILGDPVIIGIGTNGPLRKDICHKVLDLCKDRQVFWLTTTNNWQFNNTDTIHSFADAYDNVSIIDWDTCSRDHKEYFYRDGIHLNPEGRKAYVALIRDSITERYWQLLPHEKHRVLIAGDAGLLGCTSLLNRLDEDSDVLITEEEKTGSFRKHLTLLNEEHILPENMICVMQNSVMAEEFAEAAAEICPDLPLTMVYVMCAEDPEQKIPDHARVYKAYEECEEVLAVDEMHLSQEASDRLGAFITDLLDDMK